MSDCDEKSCSASSSCCEESCCCPACKGDCGGDPVTCATRMWTGAFFQAMHAAHVDILKSKIQKAWGPMLDKSADAVMEAMGAKWQSMLAEAKAKADLAAKLGGIMNQKP